MQKLLTFLGISMLILLIISFLFSKNILQRSNFIQSLSSKSDQTTFSGTYEFNWGKSRDENKRGGKLLIQQISTKEVQFALSLVGVKPTFNTGKIYRAIVNLDSNKARYQNNQFGKCELELVLNENSVTIKTVSNTNTGDVDCGFGKSVFADGSYIKIDSKIPEFPKNIDLNF